MSRYSVIFCASKQWRLLAQMSRTSDHHSPLSPAYNFTAQAESSKHHFPRPCLVAAIPRTKRLPKTTDYCDTAALTLQDVPVDVFRKVKKLILLPTSVSSATPWSKFVVCKALLKVQTSSQLLSQVSLHCTQKKNGQGKSSFGRKISSAQNGNPQFRPQGEKKVQWRMCVDIKNESLCTSLHCFHFRWERFFIRRRCVLH